MDQFNIHLFQEGDDIISVCEDWGVVTKYSVRKRDITQIDSTSCNMSLFALFDVGRCTCALVDDCLHVMIIIRYMEEVV